MSTSRPKAKWKVAYEAEVAAMDNAALLAETFSNDGVIAADYYTTKDEYRNQITHAELTRRLTACGFLPPTP